jgi:hypothetical protein
VSDGRLACAHEADEHDHPSCPLELMSTSRGVIVAWLS